MDYRDPLGSVVAWANPDAMKERLKAAVTARYTRAKPIAEAERTTRPDKIDATCFELDGSEESAIVAAESQATVVIPRSDAGGDATRAA